jgi:hypothetical protein
MQNEDTGLYVLALLTLVAGLAYGFYVVLA